MPRRRERKCLYREISRSAPAFLNGWTKAPGRSSRLRISRPSLRRLSDSTSSASRGTRPQFKLVTGISPEVTNPARVPGKSARSVKASGTAGRRGTAQRTGSSARIRASAPKTFRSRRAKPSPWLACLRFSGLYAEQSQLIVLSALAQLSRQEWIDAVECTHHQCLIRDERTRRKH